MGIAAESSKSADLQNPCALPKCESMSNRRKKKLPLIRQGLFLLGCLLIIISPLVGAVPGPGGIFVFAAGLALVLQNSEWAKRQYVKFKRKHPNKGRWADWGMRRSSARRREENRRRNSEGEVIQAPWSAKDQQPPPTLKKDRNEPLSD